MLTLTTFRFGVRHILCKSAFNSGDPASNILFNVGF